MIASLLVAAPFILIVLLIIGIYLFTRQRRGRASKQIDGNLSRSDKG